jgi:hypothetical protein
MARRFLCNVNLEKNEIQNVVIHKLATAPSTPVEGQIYYNTSDERWYLRQSGSWKDVSGRLDDLLQAPGATYILLTDNGDGTISLDVASATTSTKGLMSAADKTKLDNATALNTPSTLVQRDASGNFAANDITTNAVIINETINGATPGNHAVTKAYVDALVNSGMQVIGSIDCSTNPDYPAASTGDAYYVSVDGRIGGGSGPLVKQGDLIVAVADNAGGDEATVGASWIIIERNLDYATETTPGYIELATQAEVNAGTDGVRAVTPATLAAWYATQAVSNQYAVNVGDGGTTTFAVNHALGSTDIQVQVWDNTTGELVEPCITITDANNVSVQFNTAPASNAYRVVVQG